MCHGIAGQIVEILADRPDVARVNVAGMDREIGLALLDPPPPQPGEWVLIHLGYALQRMTEAEALDSTAFLEGEESDPDVTTDLKHDDLAPPWPRPEAATPVRPVPGAAEERG